MVSEGLALHFQLDLMGMLVQQVRMMPLRRFSIRAAV